MQLIEVAPYGDGWMLTGPGEPLLFRSGRWAEQAARRLASAIAASGCFAELRIWDRAGGLAGALRFKPLPLLDASPRPRRTWSERERTRRPPDRPSPYALRRSRL